MPYMGLVFASYDAIAGTFKKLREDDTLSPNHKPTHDMISGALSGIIGKTAIYPMDVVRKRFQVQGPHRTEYVIGSIPEYSRQSWLSCLKEIVKQEGVRGCYKGLAPSLVKVAPSVAVTFVVFEQTKQGLLWLKD
ncbi:mitochondrial thiamine pyrophosphate transporter [Apophysomyces sp. BC1015]|nr:mitochondrial thiamine pyrophosphate transporter [Apophysomyces sp. BC1015]